jgi:hypothetical protein
MQDGIGGGSQHVLIYEGLSMGMSFRSPITTPTKRFWRCLVALLGILVLTVSLAGRTFNTNLHRQAAVTSESEKERVQHRDRGGLQWTPALKRVERFYVAVCSQVVEPEQEPLLSAHVDDCLYNRPPPLS